MVEITFILPDLGFSPRCSISQMCDVGLRPVNLWLSLTTACVCMSLNLIVVYHVKFNLLSMMKIIQYRLKYNLTNSMWLILVISTPVYALLDCFSVYMVDMLALFSNICDYCVYCSLYINRQISSLGISYKTLETLGQGQFGIPDNSA